jgi:hypothetical protein
MTPQERILLAYAMMRRLWQKWDTGGESMRSLRSQLLEKALWLVPQDCALPEVYDSHEYFEGIRKQKLEDFPPLVPPPRTIEQAPLELYCLLVVHVLFTQKTGQESMLEKELLERLFKLLDRDEVKLLMRSGKVTLERLMQEGARRQDQKQSKAN